MIKHNFPTKGEGKSAKDYFAELPQWMRDNLYDIYKSDFRLFDYDPSDFY